jgi:hypothetical protein
MERRFYSPDIGRFLQPDPVDFNGDPTNLYRYCGNNPVIYYDPSGQWATTVFGAVAGGVGGFISGYAQGGWSGGVIGGVIGAGVGAAVGTVAPWAAEQVGALVGSAVAGEIIASTGLGAGASYAGQVVGNYSGHAVSGQYLPQASDLAVNPGMLIGAAAGGALSPFIQAGGAASLGTSSLARGATSVIDGIVGGSLEAAGWGAWGGQGSIQVPLAPPGNDTADYGGYYDANGNIVPEDRVLVTNQGPLFPSGPGGYYWPAGVGATGPAEGYGGIPDFFGGEYTGTINIGGGGFGPLGAGIMGQPGSASAPSGGFLLVKYL